MSDAKDSFSRLRDSMQPRLSTLSNRLQTLPDKLDSKLDFISDRLQTLPSKLNTTRVARSGSTPVSPSPTDSGPPTPYLPPPHPHSPSYDRGLAQLAERILYRSEGPDPVSGGPLLILCAAAFPDPQDIDYNKLLPYVLSNIPSERELGLGGYSVIFFAGSGGGGMVKEGRPGWAWALQAYGLLGRAVRKKIKRLWVVHERAWVRVILELMAGVVSGKFRRKIVHVSTLTELAKMMDITEVTIPPAVYLHDRKLETDILLPNFPPPLMFGVAPFHNSSNPPRVGDSTPLPAVLQEATAYLRHYLDTEGIFRIPASSAYLDVLKAAYDRRQSIYWPHWGAHTAAGLIKLYYRSLPQPCIPDSCYPAMMTLAAPRPSPATVTRMMSQDEKDAQFETCRELLVGEDTATGIPAWSRVLLLRHLFPLLALVAERKSKNKMDPVNLAVCVGGALARSDDVMKDAEAGPGVRRFIELCIERIEELAPQLPIRRRPVVGQGRLSLEGAKRRSLGLEDQKRWSGQRKQVGSGAPSPTQESLLILTEDHNNTPQAQKEEFHSPQERFKAEKPWSGQRKQVGSGSSSRDSLVLLDPKPLDQVEPPLPSPGLKRQPKLTRKSVGDAANNPEPPRTAPRVASTPSTSVVFTSSYAPSTDIHPRPSPREPPQPTPRRDNIPQPLPFPPKQPSRMLPTSLIPGPPPPAPPPHAAEPQTISVPDILNHPPTPVKPGEPFSSTITASAKPTAINPAALAKPVHLPKRRMSTSPFIPPPLPPAPPAPTLPAIHRPLRRAVSTSGLVAQRRRSFVTDDSAPTDEVRRTVRRVRSSVFEDRDEGVVVPGGGVAGGKPKLVRQLSLLYEERAKSAEVLMGVRRRREEIIGE